MDAKMNDMAGAGLSFTELERRIRALPDGPTSAYNTPSWIFILNLAGTLGAVLALLPSLLVRLMTPGMWMVDLARTGLVLTVLCWAPGFVRACMVIGRGVVRWQDEFNRQLDHDLAVFESLMRWLAAQPHAVLQRHHAFVSDAQTRLSGKISLLAGGIERLGLLPLGVSLVLAIHNAGGLDKIMRVPMWLVGACLFLAFTWLGAFLGARSRLRLQLYEMVLARSLAEQSQPSVRLEDPERGLSPSHPRASVSQAAT